MRTESADLNASTRYSVRSTGYSSLQQMPGARAVRPWRSTRRPCGETSHSSQVIRTGEQRRRGQRRRGNRVVIFMMLDGARQFPRHQSGWPMLFALMSSFSRETEFTQFVSEEVAAARSRHASRRRRIPMPASPRHRARCNHEARARIVALISCCLVRLSTGGLGPPGEIV